MNEKLLSLPALSIWQPWASLITHGYKDIENRCWWTSFRGQFLIHASKRMDDMTLEQIMEYYHISDIDPSKFELHQGGIVGTAFIANCVKKSSSKWFYGEYGFVIENARPLEFTPCRGQQRFFYVDWSSQPVSKAPSPAKKIEKRVQNRLF